MVGLTSVVGVDEHVAERLGPLVDVGDTGRGQAHGEQGQRRSPVPARSRAAARSSAGGHSTTAAARRARPSSTSAAGVGPRRPHVGLAGRLDEELPQPVGVDAGRRHHGLQRQPVGRRIDVERRARPGRPGVERASSQRSGWAASARPAPARPRPASCRGWCRRASSSATALRDARGGRATRHRRRRVRLGVATDLAQRGQRHVPPEHTVLDALRRRRPGQLLPAGAPLVVRPEHAGRARRWRPSAPGGLRRPRREPPCRRRPRRGRYVR